MKRGDHNPKQNIRLLRELVNELKQQQVAYIDVDTLDRVLANIEERRV